MPQRYLEHFGHKEKSLYGLIQAHNLGFERSKADSCLFIMKQGLNKLCVALYIDDELVAGNNINTMDEFYIH